MISGLLISYSLSGLAFEEVTLRLKTIQGNGWQAEGVLARLHGLGEGSLKLEVATLTLSGLNKPLKKLRLECVKAQYSEEKIVCNHANIYIGGEVSPLELSLVYRLPQQAIELSIKWALAGGKITSQMHSEKSGWHFEANLEKIDLEKFSSQLRTLITLPATLSLGGLANLKITGSGPQIQIKGQVQGLRYANEAGTQAGENLAAQIAFQATSYSSWKGSLVIQSGEVYSHPIYVNVADKPVIMTVDLTWQSSQLNIHSFKYSQAGVLVLEGFGKFNFKEKSVIKQLVLQVHQGAMKQFYNRYLQSWLGSDKEFSGMLEGKLEWNPNEQQWVTHLSQVNLDAPTWGIKDLNGTVQWHSQRSLPSQLSWSSARVASSITLGESQLQASFKGSQLQLLAPWQQPILDGDVTIEQFILENLGQAEMSWELRGQLHPLSVSTLSKALGGPPLQGKLSANLPPLRYKNQQLTTQSSWQIQIFDGQIEIPKLQIDEPLGSLPRLKTEVNIDKLNLETLTKVTEFGEIQGRLSGYIRNLSLINWQPVSFDAYLGTPPGDASPKKISQKAVNNLSNLGGGKAVNLISRGVFKFFENFSYEQIGWGCRLANGICEMRGAGAFDQGYYIVKGGGLPRIDVIGYNPKVDWDELLSRLKRLSHTQKPVIQR